MSGLEKGGDLRVVTLTSSLCVARDIQLDFRVLMARLKRRGLVTGYIKVIEETQSGLQHIHAVFRGRYIHQPWLSDQWREIHGASVVWIERLKGGRRGKHRVGSYLAKYMSKELGRRYSWDWGWVYRNFVATWRRARRLAEDTAVYTRENAWFNSFLRLWQSHLHSGRDPERWIQYMTTRWRQAQRLYA